MNIKTFALAALCFFPFSANATIYKCQVDGKVVYSEHPCAGSGQEFTVTPPPPSAANIQESGGIDYGAVNDGINTRLAIRSAEKNILKLERKIKKADKKIVGYRSQMNRELSVYRPPGQHAAIRGYWDSKVSDQERALDDYRRQIDKLNTKLGSLSAPREN